MIAVLEAGDDSFGKKLRKDAFKEAVRIYQTSRDAYKRLIHGKVSGC
jgi:hypothetical protein